jgi:hypothetical protein
MVSLYVHASLYCGVHRESAAARKAEGAGMEAAIFAEASAMRQSAARATKHLHACAKLTSEKLMVTCGIVCNNADERFCYKGWAG